MTMILPLFAATDKMRITTAGTVSHVKVSGSYVQYAKSGGAVTGADIIKADITSATDTDVLAGPGGATDFRTPKEFTVRNEDSTNPTDVTVSYYDGTTVYSKHRVTLQPGDCIEYNEGVGFVSLAAAALLDKNLILNSDISVSATAFADITGLNTAVLKAGIRYSILAHLHIIAAAATTGVQVGYNIGAAPTFAQFSAWQVVTNSATAAALSTGQATARDTAIIVQTTGPAAVGPMTIGGVIQPSADGTFALRLASEVASSAVTAKAGSFLQIRQER
jgi:hypothetical protein